MAVVMGYAFSLVAYVLWWIGVGWQLATDIIVVIVSGLVS